MRLQTSATVCVYLTSRCIVSFKGEQLLEYLINLQNEIENRYDSLLCGTRDTFKMYMYMVMKLHLFMSLKLHFNESVKGFHK